MPVPTPETETFRKGQGYRFTVSSIDNIGMPGQLPGRPVGGNLTIHPDIPGVPGPAMGQPSPRDGNGMPQLQARRRHKRVPPVAVGSIEGMQQPKAAAALRQAAHDGDVASVTALLEAGDAAAYIDEPDKWAGRTALMQAANGDHVNVVEALLREGCNVNAQDQRGFSALMMAAERGRTIAVVALLQAGADPSQVEETGMTALALAAAGGRREVVQTLLEGEAPPPRPRAAKPGATATIDLPDKNGRTAAVAAAQAGRLNCLRLLIEAGCDLEARDTMEGCTIFHMACARGWVEILEPLLSRGADAAALDEAGRNGWELAAGRARDDVQQILRDHAEGGQQQLQKVVRGSESTLSRFTNDPTFLDPKQYQASLLVPMHD